MSSPSEVMRAAWAEYECKPDRMKRINFGPDIILVAPPTTDAWRALERVLAAHGYNVRIGDTDSYNCRDMKSGEARSLHAFGIALDINWKTNPYIDHAGQRKPRFSDRPSQGGRADEVRLGRADTDMAEAMVEAALAIRTNNGKQVFGWGGNWRTIKDAMHFQIEVTPEDLASGIDWSTVEGTGTLAEAPPEPPAGGAHMENVAMELPKVFFDTVRGPLFGGSLSQSAVDNMNLIVGHWLREYPSNPPAQLAYVLATVLAEVGANMRPVREGFSKDDAEARKKLENKAYAKSAGPYGHAYYGRGYVQLTHLSNYEAQSAKLGIDLVQFPDRALETPIALRILVGGMMAGDFNGQGHGLPYYINETKQDFVGARRTVNVQDRAAEIAGNARSFLTAIERSNLHAVTPPATEEIGPVYTATAGSDDIATTNELLRQLLARLDAGAAVAPPPVVTPPVLTTPAIATQPGAAASLLLQQMGLGSVPPEQIAALLSQLEKAGVIVPGQNLTPVNRALGETVGKALNGKKTVLGIAGLLISMFLPQLAPFTTFLTNAVPPDVGAAAGTATAAGSQVAVQSVQDILTPLSSIIMAWGGLGKIDKWLHKPAISTAADLLALLKK